MPPPPLNASELNAMGQTLQQASNNYQRDEILTDTTKTAYGLESTATPDDVFEQIIEKSTAWRLIASYTEPNSYIFTVPDNITQIGVYLRGGGGSGGFQVTSQNNNFGATGGASGRCKNIVMDVTPGQQINVVVGTGGASSTGNGNNGGTTSFGGESVDGGQGGQRGSGSGFINGAEGSQGSDSIQLTNASLYGSIFLYGVANRGTDQQICESANKFDPFMSVPYAGGRAYNYGNASDYTYQECPPLLDGTHGGSGLCTSNSDGEDAVGAGNGGGGCVSANYRKSGAGAAGGVWIYVQGVK